jgi:hypothetical protein
MKDKIERAPPRASSSSNILAAAAIRNSRATTPPSTRCAGEEAGAMQRAVGGTIEGSFVDLRGRPWLVEEVRGEANDLQTLNLSCISDDVQGERLEILWDAEIGAIVLDEDGSSSPSTSQKSQ